MTSALSDRFWAKVDKTNGCWNWTAATSKGYGSWTFGGKTHLAHRLSYVDAGLELPDDLTIDHLCRNTLCVNPDHLEAVTLQENVARQKQSITHCVRGHKLPDTDQRQRRVCQVCRRFNADQRLSGDAPDAVQHGKRSTYVHYRCRCDLCVTASRVYQATHRKSRART